MASNIRRASDLEDVEIGEALEIAGLGVSVVREEGDYLYLSITGSSPSLRVNKKTCGLTWLYMLNL